MIVVDTSVWIDFFNGTAATHVDQLIELIEQNQPIALTDIVLTEILQGLRSEKEARSVEEHLLSFPILQLKNLEDFTLAAQLYRTARRAGITIRKTLDCLIAAPCIRTGAPLLHADSDFDRLAQCTPLRIWGK